MAKFATILCLLVAVTGIHGSAVTEVLESEMKEMQTEIADYQEKLTNFFTTLTDAATSEMTKASDAMSAAIKNYGDQWNSLVANTEVDVSSCEVSWSDKQTEADAILANVTTCINELQTEIASDFTTYNDTLNSYEKDITSVLVEISECSDGNILEYLACSSEIVADAGSDLSNWTTFAAQLLAFMEEESNFSAKLTACSDDNGLATFLTESKAAYEASVECAETATSSS